jgi:hypothetical protein
MWIVWIKSQNPYIWMNSRALCLDVVPDSYNESNRPCGEERENLSTTFSTKIGISKSNPYLGMSPNAYPYMGVPLSQNFSLVQNFSTPKGTYPQIIATYPQKDCLNKKFMRSESPKYGELFPILKRDVV